MTAVLRPLFFPLVLLFAAPGAEGQPTNQSLKQIQAIHTNGQSPRLDGYLDDPIWTNAVFVSDFLMKEPTEGGIPAERTEVAIAYNEQTLFIAARMECADPSSLRMHLDRRDNQGPAEQFIVTIDSYFDKRTGYGFGVNTAGVRFDRYHGSDNEFDRDFSFNPVWEAQTARDSNHWMVEMAIPFSQLRFRDADQQVWGINFNRWIPSRNEDIYWIYVPRNESGWISRFGTLTGIGGIAPSRRLELLPYVAGDASRSDGDFTGNPFADGSEITSRAGGDIKMGLGPNLTLDATINPDFGQVEADPAVVNLSDFEVFFAEKRPFFTEGAQLFNGGNVFYSRRIGGPPRDGGNGDFVSSPNNTTILGAAKVTGEIASGTKIGLLTALTEEEQAKNYLVADDSTYENDIEPSTLYGVGAVQQQFGPGKQHAATLRLAGVNRSMEKNSRLDSLLRRSAFTGYGAAQMRFDNSSYELTMSGAVTHVSGSAASIARTQRSSVRYFQRPDADYITYDTTRRSLTGYQAFASLEKQSGKHWLWYVEGGVESPELEKKDIGQLQGGDDQDLFGLLKYRETEPGKLLRSYSCSLEGYGNWNFGGVRQFSEATFGIDAQFANYWSAWWWAHRQFPGQDDRLTRGGPSMKNLAGWSTNLGFENPFTSTTRFSLEADMAVDELDGWLYSIDPEISRRIGNRMSLALGLGWTREDQPRQYVTALDTAGIGGGTLTYGRRYVFSRISQSTISMTIRMSYFFSPDLSLELYAEPFAASGRYYDHGELVAARGHELRKYENIVYNPSTSAYDVTDGSSQFSVPFRDFGVRSFRSNVVLRWEFNPGSTLFLVWQRNLEEDREIGRLVRGKSLFDSFSAEGSDVVALKIAYWIPVS